MTGETWSLTGIPEILFDDSSMPVTYRFDSKIVVIEMIGEYSMHDLQTTVLNSLADSSRPADAFLMINLSESRSIYERTSDEVREMARFIGSHGMRFNNRIALVASANMPYGLMRMGSVGADERGIKSEVFRTVDEARTWLLS